MNFEGLEKQKSNIPTDRGQRADEKNGFIFLVIMFTRGVMVIKMSNGLFFIFPADDNKKPLTVWGKHLCASERSH